MTENKNREYPIIRFVKQNADDCGNDTEIIIRLKTDAVITTEHEIQLDEAIFDIKEERADDDWDTDSQVAEAISRVFPGVDYEVVLPDIAIFF